MVRTLHWSFHTFQAYSQIRVDDLFLSLYRREVIQLVTEFVDQVSETVSLKLFLQSGPQIYGRFQSSAD